MVENVDLHRFPTEIIADEYLHNEADNEKVGYIFCDGNYDDDTIESYLKDLTECGFNIKSENRFNIDTKENVLKAVANIAEQDHRNTSCFLLLFLGTVNDKQEEFKISQDEIIQVSEIWRKIMACSNLKYRPKVFIFHACKKVTLLRTDAGSFAKPVSSIPYNIPEEADMLVVYKLTECINKSNPKYLTNLFENFKKFGSRDDVANIMAYTKRDNGDDNVPICVSTLRKKLHVTASEYRLHWHDIMETADQMSCAIRKLDSMLNRPSSRLTNSPKPIRKLVTNNGTIKKEKVIKKNSNTSVDGKQLNNNWKADYSHVKSKVDSFWTKQNK